MKKINLYDLLKTQEWYRNFPFPSSPLPLIRVSLIWVRDGWGF